MIFMSEKKCLRIYWVVVMLCLFISCQKSSIHQASLKGDLARVKELLKMNPELLNSKGRHEKEPLHLASEAGHLDLVKFLLSKGANVNGRNIINETPLHYAIGSNHPEVVALLMAGGADINARRSDCLTSLDLASMMGRKVILKYLEKLGAKPYMPDFNIQMDHQLDIKQKLQKVLDMGLNNCEGKGISVAVIWPDQSIWAGASGFSNPVKSELVKPESLFGIGSINKFYIAALTLLLEEEGKISLQDPLKKWLPNFINIDPSTTIRQLLNHTSGIYDFVKHPGLSLVRLNLDEVDLKKIWTPEELISTSLKSAYFGPGNGWHYSTTNYVLLRMIIEKATGSKLHVQIRERLLNPLALKSTFSAYFERIPSKFEIACNWYDKNSDGDLNNLMAEPTTAIYTWAIHYMYATATDLARWASFFFKGKVVKKTTQKKMLDFYSPTPGETLIQGYGLGVAKGDWNGIEWWGHAGIGFGYRCIVMFLPKYNVTLSIMENVESPKAAEIIIHNLFKVILDHLQKICGSNSK